MTDIEEAIKQFTGYVNLALATRHGQPRAACTAASPQWFHMHIEEKLRGVWTRTSIYAFVARVDLDNKTLGYVKAGDIMKPASLTKPARHTRGSIFDEKTWTCAGTYGIASFR